MKRLLTACMVSVALVSMVTLAETQQRPAEVKRIVAHRGASAYAPEHTAAAYRLAIAQGADYVEQDLAVTRDGVLVCLHDDTLERTTNVEEVFPERGVIDPATGRRHWLAVDFTLAEIKRLDAGSWFDPKFRGEQVLTWDEAVALVGDAAGLYPELKSPPLYRARGLNMTAIFLRSFQQPRLATLPHTRFVVQSFDAQALRDVTRARPDLARTFLFEGREAERWLSVDGMREVATFATGMGPNKLLLDGHPDIVRRAHEAGLTVTPYTFTTRAPGRITNVVDEMRYYLDTLGVDALFTDNPDRFPRQRQQPASR
jgi:glycerophosphoryl diester phosphodiesterase